MTNNSNKKLVPEAMDSLEKFKYEVANEVGVNLKNGYNGNYKVVPEATDALNRFKYEVASEVGVNLKDGYNGDISARDAGRIGGNMVKKLIQQAENSMINK